MKPQQHTLDTLRNAPPLALPKGVRRATWHDVLFPPAPKTPAKRKPFVAKAPAVILRG